MCHRITVQAITATKAQVERKAALTTEEIEKEREEVDAVAEDEEDSDEEEGAIYNPLKLPLGWDGKPIPYWLYKLHGLGQVCARKDCTLSYCVGLFIAAPRPCRGAGENVS